MSWDVTDSNISVSLLQVVILYVCVCALPVNFICEFGYNKINHSAGELIVLACDGNLVSPGASSRPPPPLSAERRYICTRSAAAALWNVTDWMYNMLDRFISVLRVRGRGRK